MLSGNESREREVCWGAPRYKSGACSGLEKSAFLRQQEFEITVVSEKELGEIFLF